MKKKLLVYDDIDRWAKNYQKKLESVGAVSSQFEVEPINNQQLDTELGVLRERQSATRENKNRVPGTHTVFDDTDVFVVDIDLVESSNPFLTGDQVGYLVRCFSKCGLIIGLSQYQKLDFDLTLKGEPGSFTDLSIKSNQIANKGLWGESWKGFRPWSWPYIPSFLDAFESKVRSVIDRLSESVLNTIGLSEVSSSLPGSAVDFLGLDPDRVTFEQFVEQSKFGIRSPDKATDSDIRARIAVARVSKIIEKLILPGQDVLVDAPHLVSRFPSLLVGDPAKKSTWDGTARFVPHEQLNLKRGIERFRFRADKWASRPVWFSSNLSNSPHLAENREPRKTIATKFAFCEDASAFYPLNECTEFLSGVESYYVRRYIRKFEGLDYGPKTNLLQIGVGRPVRTRAGP